MNKKTKITLAILTSINLLFSGVVIGDSIRKSLTKNSEVQVAAAEQPTSSSFGEHEQSYQAQMNALVMLVNEERVNLGYEPLYMTPSLCEVAQIRVKEIHYYFSHSRPDDDDDPTNNPSFSSAFDEVGINTWSSIAENLAAGNSGALLTYEQWEESAGHYTNMMNPKFTHIGVAKVYFENKDDIYGWYWVMELASFFPEFEEQEGQYIPAVDIDPHASLIDCDDHEAGRVIYGDVNNDGTVDVFDMILMRAAISKRTKLTDIQKTQADCAKDGRFNMADMVILLQYLLGMINKLPIILN